MRYFILLSLLLFCLIASTPVYAATKIHAYDVPSPACVAVGNQPCSQTASPSASPNAVSPGAGGSQSSSQSAQPSIAQTISSSPSPSSAAPCSTSQSSVSSQSTGNVQSFHYHGKHHRSAGGGFLQQFIQFLWQLLQQLFKQLGISLPNITIPCGSGSGSGSNTSPSGTPSGSGSGNGSISGTPSGAGGGNSGNPSGQPATSSAPSTQPGGTGSIGGGTTSSPGRFGMALGGGWQGYSSSQLNSYFADMESIGTQWVRFDVVWSEVQPNNSSSYNWTAFDNVVKAATQHNLKVLGILDEAPTWAQQSSCAGQTWCPPNGTSNFATFAAAAATHYAPMGVTAWEIWNEENQPVFWLSPNAASYTALLKASYTAIHQAVPSGETVVSGGVSPGAPGLIQPNTFVQQMYADGVKGYFDALGIHPYCFSDPLTVCATSSTSNTDVWGQMAYGPNNILSIMKANGDGNKQIWMTEFGADGNYTPAEVSQMMQQAFNLTANQSWAGPIFWYTYLNGDGFGLIDSNGNPTPAYSTYKQLAGK